MYEVSQSPFSFDLWLVMLGHNLDAKDLPKYLNTLEYEERIGQAWWWIDIDNTRYNFELTYDDEIILAITKDFWEDYDWGRYDKVDNPYNLLLEVADEKFMYYLKLHVLKNLKLWKLVED